MAVYMFFFRVIEFNIFQSANTNLQFCRFPSNISFQGLLKALEINLCGTAFNGMLILQHMYRFGAIDTLYSN